MIYQALTNSFRLELLGAVHDFTNDTLKVALYESSSGLSETTTAYTATGESSGTGYSAGGSTVTPTVTQDQFGTVIVDFGDVTFSTVSLTARGAMIYNSSKSDRSIMVIDFGLDITRSASDLTIRFPAADDQNAMIRIK